MDDAHKMHPKGEQERSRTRKPTTISRQVQAHSFHGGEGVTRNAREQHNIEQNTTCRTKHRTKQGEEQNLALAMSSYWINFAKTGDPSSDLSPTKWPLFTVENDEVLRFDTTSDRGIHIQSGLRKKQCDYQEINRFGSMGHKTL